jgi:hypothetical protein
MTYQIKVLFKTRPLAAAVCSFSITDSLAESLHTFAHILAQFMDASDEFLHLTEFFFKL